jgi:hypothetical protein
MYPSDWRSSPLSALEECNRVLEQHKHVLRYRSTAISTTRLDGLGRMLTSMLKLVGRTIVFTYKA